MRMPASISPTTTGTHRIRERKHLFSVTTLGHHFKDKSWVVKNAFFKFHHGKKDAYLLACCLLS